MNLIPVKIQVHQAKLCWLVPRAAPELKSCLVLLFLFTGSCIFVTGGEIQFQSVSHLHRVNPAFEVFKLQDATLGKKKKYQ